MWFNKKDESKTNKEDNNIDEFKFVSEDNSIDDFQFIETEETSEVDEYGLPKTQQYNLISSDDFYINTEEEFKNTSYDEIIESEKYDEFGRKKINLSNENTEKNNSEDLFGVNTEIGEIIEFGVLDFNKTYIETTEKWEVERKNPGVFFIYRCNDDIVQKTLCVKHKETGEVIWSSPIIAVPKQLKISNKKSDEVYMSHKVLTLDEVISLNDLYVVYTEDEEIIQDFEILEQKSKAEDIIVKYEDNKSNYIINHMLKYSPINIEVKNEDNQDRYYDESIVIEKTGNRYTVLLNHLDGILNRSLYLIDGDKQYFDFEGDLSSFLEKVKARLNMMYQISEDEYYEFTKLIILDESTNVDLSRFGNIRVQYREDIILDVISKNRKSIIDVNEESLEVSFCNERNEVVRISTRELGLNNIENTMEEIEKLSFYLDDEDIIILGLNKDTEENSLKRNTLTQLITN